jgi:two-component sensor histidine kinase
MIGEWVFSSDSGRRIRSVPDQWSGTEAGADRGMGYGIYHLTVLLPADTPPLALRVRTMATALEVRVNGQLVARAGHSSDDPTQAEAAYKPQAVPLPLRDDEGVLQFTVAVSNWEYRTGGMWEALELGQGENIFRIKQRRDDSAYILYVLFLCIAGIGITVYLLRRKETTFLFFGLFCITMALRVFSTGEYLITRRFPGLNFETVVRLEYLSFLLAVPLGFLFFFSLYPSVAGRRLKMVLLSPYSIFLATLPFLPLPILTSSVFVHYTVMFSGLLIMAYLLLTRVLPRGKSDDVVVIAGGITLGLATINDSLHSSYVLQTAHIVPLVLAAFTGVLAVILARRLLIDFGRAEFLGEQLSLSNERLARELENTDAARVALEEALKDRETLIYEIHHRVKNSLQIVASIISLQARRIADPNTRSMFQRLNLRIRSISLVHEKLYDVSSVTHIEIDGYIRKLVRMLESAYASENTPIRLTLPSEKLIASLEFCIDLGLMLNELVSNAFIHGAFQQGKDAGSCLIAIVRRGTSLEVTVQNPLRENSPTSTFGAEKDQGLGFRILRAVLRRSGGTIVTEEQAGNAVVTLTIPWEEVE